MKSIKRSPFLVWSLLLLTAATLRAQTVEEMCPNAKDTGALLGVVSDVDAAMALPGATVRATWETDGTPGIGETQTGIDGGFTLCYLPIGTELTVQAMFATMTGQPVSITLAETITQQDIGFSLTGGATSTDKGQVWACIGPPDSQMRVQLGSLVRCDPQWPPLDRCPKQELERVSASAGSRGRGAMREMVDSLVDAAERLGANALVDIQGGRGSISALAVKIEVDPSTC